MEGDGRESGASLKTTRSGSEPRSRKSWKSKSQTASEFQSKELSVTRSQDSAGPVLCVNCAENVPAYLCNQCQNNFCEDCQNIHGKETINGTKHTLRKIYHDQFLAQSGKFDDSSSTGHAPSTQLKLMPKASNTRSSDFRSNVSSSSKTSGDKDEKTHKQEILKQLMTRVPRERSEILTPRSKHRKCLTHPNKDVQLHCLECNKIVCGDCIVEDHQRHQFTSIAEAGNQIRNELQAQISPVKSWYDSNAKLALTNLSIWEGSYKTKSNEFSQLVHKRADQLHQDIDRIKEGFLEDLQSKNTIDLEEYQMTKEALEEQIKSTEEVIGNIDMAITEADDIALLRAEFELKSMISSVNMRIQTHEVKPPTFIPGASTDENIRELFGNNRENKPKEIISWSLQSTSMKSSSNFDLVRLTTIPCVDGEPIHAMVPLGNSELWVSSLSNPKQIQLIGLDGSKENPGELDFVIRDLAISRNGDLYMSCFETRCIKRLRLNGALETFFSASPLHPLGIHVSRSGVLLACIVDSSSTDGRQIRPYSKRQVVKISRSGKVLKRLAFSIDMRLFTSPIKVAETVEEEICVIDKTAKDQGRLIVFTRNEQVKFRYNGPTDLKTQYAFCPTDLACDNYGHVIVTDANNNAIHMIDKHGQVLRVHQVSRDWIDVPHSVVVDNKGLIIIGDSAGTLHVIKYLSDNH